MTDMQTSAGDEFRDDTELPAMSGPRRPAGRRSRFAEVDDVLPDPVGVHGGACTRWWAHILDGSHEWGSVDVSPSRHGVTRYRLVVFPPGIDTAERHLLRLWRAWPTWGALLWLTSQIVLDAVMGPGAAMAVSTIVYLGSGAILFGRVNELRSRVRTLSVVRIAGYTDHRTAAMYAELKSLVAALCYAEDQRDRGQSSPIMYEAVRWQVYDRMGQIHHGPAADQASR